MTNPMANPAHATGKDNDPQIALVVDVDDTLLRTDLLLESFWAAMGRDPLATLKATWTHFRNRARVKQAMAQISDMTVEHLPLNGLVLAVIRQARAAGREVILASGSDQRLVNRLGDRIGLKGPHLASDGKINMTGANKRDALVARYGAQGFDYIADAPVDLLVWEAARNAYPVDPGREMRTGLDSHQGAVLEIPGGWHWRDLGRALRPHQWVKNLLLLLPLISVHVTDLGRISDVLLAIAAFCLAASSIYIVNDFFDLDADRRHPRKHLRPFAAGRVPIKAGMFTSVGLGVTALAIGAMVSVFVFGLVAFYIILALAYSVYLKRQRWIDIWALASLYVLRIIAGAAAAGLGLSGWLIAFIFPVFMALGCVKRMTEVTRAPTEARLPGRGYAKRDRPDLLNMSILSAFNADIIFIAYTYSNPAYRLYIGIWELRWCVIPITAWMAHMILTGWRGQQNYDPVVFALRDRTSLMLAIVTVLGLLNAAAFATFTS